MIIYPLDLADRLYELLKAKTLAGGYVVTKQHRKTVIEAELLLRKLFEIKPSMSDVLRNDISTECVSKKEK